MRVSQRQRRHLWESLREWLSVSPFTRVFLKSPSSRGLSAIAELLVLVGVEGRCVWFSRETCFHCQTWFVYRRNIYQLRMRHRNACGRLDRTCMSVCLSVCPVWLALTFVCFDLKRHFNTQVYTFRTSRLRSNIKVTWQGQGHSSITKSTHSWVACLLLEDTFVMSSVNRLWTFYHTLIYFMISLLRRYNTI